MIQSLEGDDEIQEMPDEEFSWKESYRFKEKDSDRSSEEQISGNRDGKKKEKKKDRKKDKED